MNYIKDYELQNKTDPKQFIPDLTLNTVFIPKNKQPNDSISYNEFFSILFDKLTPMHQIKRVYIKNQQQQQQQENNILLRKGKYEPVLFKLESRGGNKKVTNISNISTFEIDSNQLQSRLRIACSVSVTIITNNNTSESNEYSLDVQGNQIQAISEILKSKIFCYFINIIIIIIFIDLY